ncbi:bactofilin family protein [Salisaeta longa]|uniref:bactofilin family protein n=1 Tax=Salisaeta longa TaxID=503170 RepID=UPI001E3B6A30|nr:polymer-forming cytoskeletal protein [Salisaeta longa]
MSSDQLNLVGEGTTFEGTVRAESDVRASGRILGTLRVQGRAIVAESGAVDGEVHATNADIAGTVSGELFIQERLVLKSSAQVDGVIHAGRLVVEEGATFNGECHMGEQSEAEPPLKEDDSGKAAGAGTASSAQKSSSSDAKQAKKATASADTPKKNAS